MAQNMHGALQKVHDASPKVRYLLCGAEAAAPGDYSLIAEVVRSPWRKADFGDRIRAYTRWARPRQEAQASASQAPPKESCVS